MATVNQVAATSSATTSGTTSAVRTATQESEDRFLKLLVTQMKNQDPLNPLDNAEVTSQMAQLSTVTGINKLNDAMQSISSMFTASQALQAAGLIGHDVVMDGSLLGLDAGAAKGMLGLSQDADLVNVVIKDDSGAIVRTLDLGAQSAGMVDFSWDGVKDDGSTARDGTYTFEVKASSGGIAVDAAPYILARVSSVSLSAEGGAQLNLGGMGYALMSDIRQIL